MIIKGLAGLSILLGTIFALQGAGILPGSYMTGDSFWLYVGIVMILAGLAFLLYQSRKNSRAGEN